MADANPSTKGSPHGPLVSLALPVYNGAAYVAQTIEHALGQTYGNIELVISDNASTDATPQICQEFAARDPRIRYQRADENHGAAWNFNRVIELSRGKYFAWVAADDLIAPTFVEKAVDLLEADSSIVLAMPRAAVINSKSELIVGDCDQGARMSTGEILTDEVFPDRWDYLSSKSAASRYYGVIVLSRRCYELFAVIRTDALRKTPGLRPFPNSEKVFLAEMSMLGRMVQIPETLFFSRWYNERFTNNPQASVQNSHWKPKSKKRFVWPHQPACAWGYLIAPWRYPLSLSERIACGGRFLQFMFQVRRWPEIVRGAIRGTGMTVSIPQTAAVKPVKPVKPSQPELGV
ncbi:MAG: glycosyltransferase family 2 protein [Pirellulales bacterium]